MRISPPHSRARAARAGQQARSRRPGCRQSGRRLALATAAAVVLSVLVPSGCDRRPPAPPNIVLITVDTLRADRLNPYGYDGNRTPSASRLAREGIVFENAICDTTWTLPSLSSVMTGKYPFDHRVRTWNDRLQEEEQTLAEILSGRAYVTAAVVGSYPLDRRFGLAQGFQAYDDEMNLSLAGEGSPPEARDEWFGGSAEEKSRWILARQRSDAYRPDDQVADRALAWLETKPQSPFFLWVHFFGPHEKTNLALLPAEVREAATGAAIARYDADVEFVDLQVGRLLDRLEAGASGSNTAVIFHSDHGQSLNEHGFFGHGFDLYETTAHVPLIVRLPDGGRAGERVTHVVRNLDIFATALQLAGAAAPAGTEARDLLSRSGADGAEAYIETYHMLGLTGHDLPVGDRTVPVGTVLKGVRSDGWKLVVRQPELAEPQGGLWRLPPRVAARKRVRELYDLARDPAEKRDLSRTEPEKRKQMEARLATYLERDDRAAPSGQGLDDAARERLRSLGYLP